MNGEGGDTQDDGLVVYDFDPRNLPSGYLEAIGYVIAAGSQTDNIMQEFIGTLLKIDNIETIALTTHLSTPLKDNIIRALAELNAPFASEIDEIDDLLDSIRNAMEKRNAVAHNAFARHPDTGEVVSLRMKARGSLQIEFTPITIDELNKQAEAIYEAGLALFSFMINRGIGTDTRQPPLREQFNRKKNARQKRRDDFGDKY